MSNTTNASEKTRKPRVRKTGAMLAEEAQKAMQRAAKAQALESLGEIEGLADMKEAVKSHKKYLFEGEALCDDVKYQERKNALQSRLANLDAKRAIALKDVFRRKDTVARFENALETIGKSILVAVSKGQSVEGNALEKMFYDAISEDDRKLLLSVEDPYAGFRRKNAPKSVTSDENSMDSDADDDVFSKDEPDEEDLD